MQITDVDGSTGRTRPPSARSLQKEASSLAELDHPHIPTLVDYFSRSEGRWPGGSASDDWTAALSAKSPPSLAAPTVSPLSHRRGRGATRADRHPPCRLRTPATRRCRTCVDPHVAADDAGRVSTRMSMQGVCRPACRRRCRLAMMPPPTMQGVCRPACRRRCRLAMMPPDAEREPPGARLKA